MNAGSRLAPNKLAYAHIEIPRTGSTSVKKALGCSRERHIPAVQLRELVGRNKWDHVYTFSVVRNPLERSVSEYLHAPNPEQHWPNFEDFVIDYYYYDNHSHHLQDFKFWWPCWKWLTDYYGKLIVKEWLRFEDNPFPYLMTKLGLRHMPHESAANNRHGDWRYYHTPITRSIIEAQHRGDFERFYNGG